MAPLGTDWRKPFLETAPAVIVVFEVHQGPDTPRPYYVKESVGIAVGFLLAALHRAGLATLTHTPSPMRFLNQILRPAAARAWLPADPGRAIRPATPPSRTSRASRSTTFSSGDRASTRGTVAHKGPLTPDALRDRVTALAAEGPSMLDALHALALAAGLLAAVNPCGFALLPAYLPVLVLDGADDTAS